MQKQCAVSSCPTYIKMISSFSPSRSAKKTRKPSLTVFDKFILSFIQITNYCSYHSFIHLNVCVVYATLRQDIENKLFK